MRWCFETAPGATAARLLAQADQEIVSDREAADIVVSRYGVISDAVGSNEPGQLARVLDCLGQLGWVPPDWPPMEHGISLRWQAPAAGLGRDPWGNAVVARASGKTGQRPAGYGHMDLDSPTGVSAYGPGSLVEIMLPVRLADDWRRVPRDVVAEMGREL